MNSNDNPDSGSGPPERTKHSSMSRFTKLEEARDALVQKHKDAAAFSRDNRPYIHDQVRRVNASYSPPWYSAFFTPLDYRFRALEENMIYMCSEGGRVMTDSEAAAFSERMLAAMDTQVILRGGVMVAAAAVTARGAHRFRFPFFTPQFKNKMFSPVGGSPAVTWGWHSLRFVAYYGLLRFTLEAPLGGYNVASTMKGMSQDSRMTEFYGRVRAKIESGQGFDDSFRPFDQERQASGQNEGPYPQEPEYEGTTSERVSQRTAQKWASYRQRAQEETSQSSPQSQDQYQSYQSDQSSHTAQPQQRSTLWDSPSVTQDIDNDDASPVAASFRQPQQRRSSFSEEGGGSAWERVRKQAGSDSPTSSPSSEPSDRGSWSQDASSRTRQAGSFGNEETGTKTQDQKQFDQLLEKERKAGEDGGVGDGGGGSWKKW